MKDEKINAIQANREIRPRIMKIIKLKERGNDEGFTIVCPSSLSYENQ